jgi:mycothiol synthase
MTGKLPAGLQMRPPVLADLEAMVALATTCELAYYGESDETLEDMRTLWNSPTFNMAEQCRLVFDSAGRLICAAYFREQTHIRYGISLDVLPGCENDELRVYLMDLGEAWARQDMLKAPEEARIFQRDWVAAKDTPARAWYGVHPEFTEIRRFWEMQIELDAAPAIPAWPAGVELRPFDIERDTRAVFEADDAIFQDHWGSLPADYPTWRHWTVEREDFDPDLWFIAWSGDEVAGISLCRDGEKGWVDTLGVTRPWRGKGLGLALLHHSFGEFYRRGRRRAGLGVDAASLTGATRLYERAGMHVAHESVVYEKELRAGVDLSIQTLAV